MNILFWNRFSMVYGVCGAHKLQLGRDRKRKLLITTISDEDSCY